MNSMQLAGAVILTLMGGFAIYFFAAAFYPQIRLRYWGQKKTSRSVWWGRQGGKWISGRDETRIVTRGPHIGIISCLAWGTLLATIVLYFALGDYWPSIFSVTKIVITSIVFIIIGAFVDEETEPTVHSRKTKKIKQKPKKPRSWQKRHDRSAP